MPITQAILPVAGLGTRFLPWTKVVPKELLPIGNTPFIALLVDECLSVGITDICFIISRGKEAIPQYFEHDEALQKELEARGKASFLEPLEKYKKAKFHVVYQEEQLGDGHALLQAAGWVKSDAVAVLFGDDWIGGPKNGLQQLCEAYENLDETKAGSMPALLCLENIPREKTSNYGIVEVEEASSSGRVKKIKGLVEKPKPEEAPSTLGIVGKYIIPRTIFDSLPSVESGKGGEIRLIDALIKQKDSVAIYGCQVEGKRYDTGNPEGYKEAVRDLA